MLQKPRCQVIAIEEHYYDRELVKHFGTVEPNPAVVDRMFEFGERRLKEMDEAGIDIQVLSHGAPSAQRLSGDGALAITQGVNDRDLRGASSAAGAARSLRRLRGAADLRSEGCSRRARAHCGGARLQGRHDPWPCQ